MTYEFKCTNISCKERNEIVLIEKYMRDAGKPEYCKACKEAMQMVFSSPGIKTSDGYKS